MWARDGKTLTRIDGHMRGKTVLGGLSGEGYMSGKKYGCTNPIKSWKKGVWYIVCGCFEIWCPVKGREIAPSNKDRECFTLRKIFGCYKRDKGGKRPFEFIWHPDCKETHGVDAGKGIA